MKIFKRKNKAYSQYITEYQKKHYKQFRVSLSEEEYNIFKEYCELKGISRASFLKQAIMNITNEYIELKKASEK